MKRQKEEEAQLFQKLNQQYWGGKLPSYRILGSDVYGNGRHGVCRKKQREIHLGTELQGSELERVLLHEMCHAAVCSNGHGKKWLDEMLRIAKLGASTREDWENYQDKSKVITAPGICEVAYEVGLESDLSWSHARVYIGREYGLTDHRGKLLSKENRALLRRLRTEFLKGRRLREKIMPTLQE